MPNVHLINRLNCLLDISRSIHHAGKNLSNATIGIEREFFINHILNMIIAPPFRLGSGDITDSEGNKSGQMDMVIEYGNAISFPMISPESPRLYMAEGVCAVIEIKSDLVKQWNQVVESHKKLVSVKRRMKPLIRFGEISETIPYIVVAFEGWTTEETLKNKLNESGIDGILILDSALYQSKIGNSGCGAGALLAFLAHLQHYLGNIISATTDFESYFK